MERFTAAQAQEIANKSRSNYKKAIENIKEAAKKGYSFAGVYVRLSYEDLALLREDGFEVEALTNAREGIAYNIKW